MKLNILKVHFRDVMFTVIHVATAKCIRYHPLNVTGHALNDKIDLNISLYCRVLAIYLNTFLVASFFMNDYVCLYLIKLKII